MNSIIEILQIASKHSLGDILSVNPYSLLRWRNRPFYFFVVEKPLSELALTVLTGVLEVLEDFDDFDDFEDFEDFEDFDEDDEEVEYAPFCGL